MEQQGRVIETGVDKLVKLVGERGKIALADAAKELGVSIGVIQEWVDFLEEEGIISVEYKLTKPYLVERKLTKKEVEEKAKEFAGKKDAFVRKAEVSLSFLEKQAEDLKDVKGEFDRLKSELGIELDSVRSELKELEGYQKLKAGLQEQIEEQKKESKAKIDELTGQILREQKKYHELAQELRAEKSNIAKERESAKSIEESEKLLNKKFLELKLMVNLMEKKIYDEDTAVKNSESHIERLNAVMNGIMGRVEEEKAFISPLIEKGREQEAKIAELQEKILKKIAEKQKNAEGVKNITRKVRNFFDKKMFITDLIDKVNKDRDELEKSLVELIRKAKSFQLSSKGGSVGREITDLEKKFEELNRKKAAFEQESRHLRSFFK